MLLEPFISVFVAVDAFGVLPIFISLTEVSSLLLAAIGVMMVRKGIMQILMSI